jgi:hypothetical protein
MKTCPYCAEQIQDGAKVCRYCSRELVHETTTEEKHVDVLKKAMTAYQLQGWIVVSAAGDTIQLVRNKKFNWGAFIVLLIVGIFTFEILPFIYLLYWAVKRAETVTLTITDDGTVLTDGNRPAAPPAPSTPLTDEQKKANNNALLIVCLIIAGLGLVWCLCMGGASVLAGNNSAVVQALPFLV